MRDMEKYQEIDTYELFKEVKSFRDKTDIVNVNLTNISNQEFIGIDKCRFFKLTSLSYDHDYPHREAFENVLSSIDNPSFNFAYILSGTLAGIDIYVGTIRNDNSTETKMHASEYGKMMKSFFEGNFQGSNLHELKFKETQKEIFDPIKDMKRTCLITGVPSINKNEGKKETDFQGIDRLINSMAGEKWRLIIICEPVSDKEIQNVTDNVYKLYETLYKCSKLSMQLGDNQSISGSKTKTYSESNSINIGINENDSDGSSSGSSSYSTNKSSSKGTNLSIAKSKSDSNSNAKTTSVGQSFSVTGEVINKKVQETLKYLDEELLERLKQGHSKGLFKVSVYAMTENSNNLNRLKSSIFSIFQGDKSSFSPLIARMVDEEIEQELVRMIGNFQNYTEKLNINPYIPIMYSNPVYEDTISLSTYMTSKEISLIAALPMKEVPGLELKEGVEFGLNVNLSDKETDKIILGNIIHRGKKLKENLVHISKDNLSKHLFVAGVTGSGKTTTCQKILIESKLPFWVIEPVKTEYRALYGKNGMEDIIYFTIGNEKLAPFRFNPFEILEGENITSHVDMLKATFTTAFPMEASMPQILEESIYKCYEEYGWDIENDTNSFCDNPWDQKGLYFPMLSDLVVMIQKVVEDKKFGKELQANYIGSLVSRISNLTVGSKGQMLNCKLSIDFNDIIDKKVIFEMEDLKSPDDKALIMGFILTRMAETIKIRHKKDINFKHITLVEEAHRLLSKVEYGDSGSKKVSVEMFTDLLAEVRKYGESLIIVDQIPNKLAVEVLKNTNTKIIHKIFAKDDKEVIGDTMLMDDKQKQYLSSLQTGEAIVFSDGWNKPIHIKVKADTDSNYRQIDDIEIRKIGEIQKEKFISSYCSLFINEKISVNNYKELLSIKPKFISILAAIKNGELNEKELHSFNNELENISCKTNIQKSSIWGQLIWEYLINTGMISENISKKEYLITGFQEIYDDFLSNQILKIDMDFLKYIK